MDHELRAYLDSLQAQLSSMEQRMATKADIEAVEQRMATKADLGALEQRMDTNLETLERRMGTKTDLETLEQRMATGLDALGRRMAADLASAVERLEESIKGRKEDENALYRVTEDHEQRIKRLEQKAL